MSEPELIGTPARLASLPRRRRRWLLGALFVFSALAVLAAAEPFATSLVDTGKRFGVSEFLLVQWLAPLASEAPELIVALLLARRANADDALGTLLSSKVNQWTLLVGSIPLAYLAGGGSVALPLDGRQVEEILLTAAQTALGFAVLLRLRFPRWASVTVLVMFVAQFAWHGAIARYVLSAAYGVLALAAMWHNRSGFPLLAEPFTALAGPARAARRVVVTLVGVVVLALGAVLLVAPGPGLIVIALGLVVLGTEYEWARRHGHRVLRRARQAADETAARPIALAGAASFGVAMVAVGVVLLVVDSLPGAGISTGVSVLISGLAILATLAWSVRSRA